MPAAHQTNKVIRRKKFYFLLDLDWSKKIWYNWKPTGEPEISQYLLFEKTPALNKNPSFDVPFRISALPRRQSKAYQIFLRKSRFAKQQKIKIFSRYCPREAVHPTLAPEDARRVGEK